MKVLTIRGMESVNIKKYVLKVETVELLFEDVWVGVSGYMKYIFYLKHKNFGL